MRILYIDIDSLRPDHLGCYGYHGPTSPNIDRVAGLTTATVSPFGERHSAWHGYANFNHIFNTGGFGNERVTIALHR